LTVLFLSSLLFRVEPGKSERPSVRM